MDIFVSRQPIFDNKMGIYGYSILSRRDPSKIKGNEVTAATIIDGPLMMGMKALTDHKKAFVTFTSKMVLDDMAVLLNPDEFVIDIVEPIDTETLKDALKSLKETGYTVAIDGKEYMEVIEKVADSVDIIRVDFNTTGPDLMTLLMMLPSRRKLKMMAVNVNQREQFEFARGLGFDLFIGHFFMRPSMVVSKDIQGFKNAYLKIMSELHKENPEYDKISEAVASDLSLSYKILKLVNSSAYSGISKINDIQQALVRIGMKDLYKWISLIVLREFTDGKPSVYAWTSIIRAKALENIASLCGLKDRKEEMFITGMFSMIDIILERPMEDILSELPLSDTVCDALKGVNNVLRKGLSTLEAYEKGEWEKVVEIQDLGGFAVDNLIPQCYFSAVEWAKEVADEHQSEV